MAVISHMFWTPQKTAEVRSLINRPGADLDFVDCDGKHLEIIARSVFLIVWNNQTMFLSVRERNMTEILDLPLTRQAGSVPSLQSLSRDAVLLILSTNNSQERLVTPLVDRLEGEITTRATEMLLASYSERN